jgi:hypothetical protein
LKDDGPVGMVAEEMPQSQQRTNFASWVENATWECVDDLLEVVVVSKQDLCIVFDRCVVIWKMNVGDSGVGSENEETREMAKRNQGSSKACDDGNGPKKTEESKRSSRSLCVG